jgi:hypothetical protein
MFCPGCGAEYVAGVEECVDCEVSLVADAPTEPFTRDGSDWIELLVVTSEHEAELIRGYLESEGIPCNLESLVFHAEPFTFGPLSKVRIHVPRDRATSARELIAARERESASVPTDPGTED